MNPETLTTLRSGLVSSLGELLGTYIFSNGLTTPAAWVDDGSEPPVEEPAVNGLELVIRPSLEVPMQPILGGAWQQTFTTQVILKQWDIAATTLPALNPCIDAIAEIPELLMLPPRRVVRSTRLDNIETLTIPVQVIELYAPD